MPELPSIAVVGSMNIDMVAYAERVPRPGETVIGDRFEMGFGGKGANQAVMARLLGADVSMIGCLGEDAYAEMTRANFSSYGLDATHVGTVPGSSGVAPIWVEADGTNRIIVVPGANGSVTATQAAAAIEALPAVAVALGQLEIPQEATLGAFRAAKARGATTILNPAPAAQLHDDLLPVTDWLIPNEPEFTAMAGTETADAEAVAGFGAQQAVRLLVTLGKAGVMVLAPDGELHHLPAPEVDAADTTGAGDAFVGAFAYGLAAGLDELTSAKLGVACATDSVRRPGAQTSLPDQQRCREILAAL